MFNKSDFQTMISRKKLNQAARGLQKADLVIKNAQFLDVFSGTFVKGDVAISDGLIVGVIDSYEGEVEIDASGLFLVPGFIDAHVHIESSLLSPAQFSEIVLPEGTTSAIWDPHEIANVKGKDGINWALEASQDLDLDIFVMVPSCVPSTPPSMGLETSGAVLVAKDLESFRGHPRVLGLAEMMNVPGVLYEDQDVLEKLTAFQGLKTDGHCPLLTGKDLNAYALAGALTCHESTSAEEAKEKLTKGIHVLVREGSCAKNAHDLLPLLTPFSSNTIGMCSDDRNPLDILDEGHIHAIINIGLKKGLVAEALYRSASYAPAQIYGLLDRGAIAPGYLADLVLVQQNDAGTFKGGCSVKEVIKRGVRVSGHKPTKVLRKEGGRGIFATKNLNLNPVSAKDFLVSSLKKNEAEVKVIGVIPNQIITHSESFALKVKDGCVKEDLAHDILKIAVLERHQNSGKKSIAFVRGFHLKKGAIATSINHDCHNVIVVGASDEAMAAAVNELITIDGGIVVWQDQSNVEKLPLGLGGLMTDESPQEVYARLKALKGLSREMGCILDEPFLQLSFLALPVIPHLKITDMGLVDVDKMGLVSVFV